MFLEITLTSTRSPTVTTNSSSCRRGDKLRFLCSGMIMLGLMVSAASVHADTVSINAFKDATIFGTSGNADTGNANSMGPGLFIGADDQLNIKRSLLQFDLAAEGIPAGSTIDNVTLSAMPTSADFLLPVWDSLSQWVVKRSSPRRLKKS